MTVPKSVPEVHAHVDHDRCVGVGMCRVHAPNAFRFDANRLAVFDPRGSWSAAELREAVDACPMSAISLVPRKDV
jgi:ferredoxin